MKPDRLCGRLIVAAVAAVAAVEAAGADPPAIRLETGHAAFRLDGATITGWVDHRLALDCPGPCAPLIVLRADAPLEAEALLNAAVQLRPGWDGTLGCGLYGLQIRVPVAGRAEVSLRPLPVPPEPQPGSPLDLARFRRDLARRGSRFPDDPDGFASWRLRHRQLLAERLMGGGLPPRVPAEPRVTHTREFPGFTLREVRYRSRPDRENTLLISLPRNVDHAPLLLALHGHEAPWGQADPEAYRPGHADDFCAWFAQRGWAVLQPATMDHRLQRADWTLQGEWTWDAMTSLDYATGLRGIDAGRIAVCGLSTGGHLAMNVLALDDRVRAGVVGCVLSTWNHYRRRVRIPPHCDCGILAQLGDVLEQCDWAALAAPKAVQFQHGRRDAALGPGAHARFLLLNFNTGILPMEEFHAAFDEVRRAWRVAGRPGAVELLLHGGGHQIDNQAAFDWLCAAVGRPSPTGTASSPPFAASATSPE